MQSTNQPAPVSKKMLWAGRIMSALPVLALLFSASMKLMKPPGMEEGFKHLGYPMSLALALGILELACTVIYVIPRTSVLEGDSADRLSGWRDRHARTRWRSVHCCGDSRRARLGRAFPARAAAARIDSSETLKSKELRVTFAPCFFKSATINNHERHQN